MTNDELDQLALMSFASARFCQHVQDLIREHKDIKKLEWRLALAEEVCEGVAMYSDIYTNEKLLALHSAWLVSKDSK